MYKRINKYFFNTTTKWISFTIAALMLLSGCKKYLNVAPDNIATINDAFNLRNEAEKFLFTCYSYLPHDGNATLTPNFLSGDECWTPYELRSFDGNAWQIARSNQNANSPYMNFWDGSNGGTALWQAIRNCNIFLENIAKVPDMTSEEKSRWIGEVDFLKAYYHFYLLRMYGPIPIVDKNLDISSSPDAVKVTRQPFDSCVNYIATLLDTAALRLPEVIQDQSSELGRVTRPIAMAVKAKLLVTAASPLFNGNSDYANFKDQAGIQLINTTYSLEKWKRAEIACKAAIDECHGAGIKLYKFPGTVFSLTDTTMTEMSIRNAVCEKWNSEEIWANPNSQAGSLQQICMAHIDPDYSTNLSATQQLCAPIKMAKLFYTKNGVPIDEDKTLNFSDPNELRIAVDSERINLISGYTTAQLNFDREPRFYADLGFDGGMWYMENSPTNTDVDTWKLEAKYGQYGGSTTTGFYSVTGYFIKKLVNWEWVFNTGGTATIQNYPWPEFRLADLYLLYSEAVNEAEGPVSDAFLYIDSVRARAGLMDIKTSWQTYSSNVSKYSTQDGLRKIIQQERLIELAFEGSRFWDLRRWKLASTYLNQAITGWDVSQQEAKYYYRPVSYYTQKFVSPRDYLWPIKTYDIEVNPKLVQNPGW